MNALSAIVQHLQHGLERNPRPNYHTDDEDHNLSHVEKAAPEKSSSSGKELSQHYTTEGVVSTDFARRYSGSFMLMGERRHVDHAKRTLSDAHKDDLKKSIGEEKKASPLPVLDEHMDGLKDLLSHHPMTGSANQHHLPMSMGPVAEDYQRRYKGSFTLVGERRGSQSGERRGSLSGDRKTPDSLH
mmetsp:Transcript_13698/g.22620  ORF Transcript_13698/g.22620 Transcript_13698/m.22620 type:complete len:186 (+) Transcript_13698:259-816(+)|eukprot:CAMPEP_0184656084 /NCGR_PEP_ID=MMETSP0308-20130426/15538_1 /TAXON_ID=38269 /ORGANISM="Gloeochaete witrockiana, Strain SAG 46.84" /LENGTH=185 /DNA_ID=CAMNT_0027093011 /DNA_START=247 /DNA_END=804 /DNA_ORIENTATION=-